MREFEKAQNLSKPKKVEKFISIWQAKKKPFS